MKYGLAITIHKDGVTLSGPGGDRKELVPAKGLRLVDRVAAFREQAQIVDSRIVLFIAEDYLFVKGLELPGKTSDIKEAVGYQLGLLTPFADDAMLHAYTARRVGDVFQIMLVAVPRLPTEQYIQELIAAGYTIIGVYPENQRYVSAPCPKGKWALIMPGRFTKALLFSGSHLQDRLLCHGNPSFAELQELCGTEQLYHLQPPTDAGRFMDGARLIRQAPLLKEFNLLPATYRKRDYSGMMIAALLVLNLVALLTLGGGKIYQMHVRHLRLDERINTIMPEVRKVNQSRVRARQLEQDIDRLSKIGKNPDLIAFMTTITRELPESTYLEQMRMDKKTGNIVMQGYTKDIAGLTSQLQALNQAQLKSTSRRRDKTYFQMEVHLP